MTRIWLLSDLHQEFCREPSVRDNAFTRFEPADHEPADYDMVVLAGDVDVSLEASIRWIGDRFGGSTKPVFYTPGNHDFFTSPKEQFTMSEMKDIGRDFAEYMNVNLLMNDTFVVNDDTRLVGATLWTDFVSVGRGMQKAKEAEASGRFGMNDYKRIKRPSSINPTKRKRLRPEDTIREHQSSRTYIERELATPFDGSTVVVTHHAPSPQSLDPAHLALNWCYASNLELMIREHQPNLWLHGHIHRSVDYSIGTTLIVSNPHGYRFEPAERDNGFAPDCVIEVPSRTPRLVQAADPILPII